MNGMSWYDDLMGLEPTIKSTFCPFCGNKELAVVCEKEDEEVFALNYFKYRCEACTFYGEQLRTHTCSDGSCSFYPTTHNRLNLLNFFKNKDHELHFLLRIFDINKTEITCTTINEILKEFDTDLVFECLSAEERDLRYREYWKTHKGDYEFDYSEYEQFYNELYPTLFKRAKQSTWDDKHLI